MRNPTVILLLIFVLGFGLARANAADADTASAGTVLAVRQVSPYSVALSSALVPGLGQIRTGHPVQGAIIAVALGGVFAGALIVRASYLDVYNHEYIPVAQIDPVSAEAKDAFNRSNQRFKTSQFLLFTALGIWAYGVVDSYVGAHIFNAERKAEALDSEPFDMDVEIRSSSEDLRTLLSFAF